MDQFYTPPGLAGLLVDTSKVRRPALVADFAVGDGALLRAAQTRWKNARLFGSDVDPTALQRVTGLSAPLQSAIHDFLSDASPPARMQKLRGKCDVILLNPPFTCRGNTRYSALLRSRRHLGSKALAFVARALDYLSPSGEALAIVPASCLTSERDRELLNGLDENYAVKQIGEINRNAFANCSVSVVIIRIKQRKRGLTTSRQEAINTPMTLVKSFGVEVMRGSLPVWRILRRPGDVPCIHSTDLRGGALSGLSMAVASASRIVEGRVVLLPRVGRPTLAKLVIADVRAAALTDCVIALRTTPAGREDELHRLMKASWDELKASYGGSCAPYVTIERLRRVLKELGVGSTVVKRMRHSEESDDPLVAEGTRAA